jgi:hypothetical protein
VNVVVAVLYVAVAALFAPLWFALAVAGEVESMP